MSHGRREEIYDRLRWIADERRCYDGSNSFGEGIDQAKLEALSDEEIKLTAELEGLNGVR